jgi:hypothetical protein
MKKYYINLIDQTTGKHVIHTEGCYWLELIPNPIFFGYFFCCENAINEAKKYFKDIAGCKHCYSKYHKI